MRDSTSETITSVRQRLCHEGRDTRHQIIAGLSFGFWSGMLGARYEDLWRSALRHAFPNSSGARKDVARDVEAIRKFRNRLAHHDSMLNIDIPFEMRRVHRVAAYIDTTVASWLARADRSLAVYAERPTFGFDTVVVPAKRAWPLYQDTQAYVCQPGRWFQPVERIAFYADQCIQAPVPKILYRRDNVTWTPREAERLADSDDRNDRKIASVITASREQGWAEGMYQVFLLSGPGHPQHRQLDTALPHETSGRGSAFVQRQRYVSLHQLETAHTTADLST
ncbi:hypothetical protein BCY76_013955 [Nesterenkonia sp. PF2B19]|nr:hypothetical protein BCY76_013955 [Nesterenkonia sp. PF2B19]